MALIKETTINGVPVSYFHIYKTTYDKDKDKTLIRVRAYSSKEVRESNDKGFVNMPEFKIARWFEGELNRADAYVELVKPITSVDDEGNEVVVENILFGAEEDI